MVLPHQIPAAGMGGKDECVSRGSEHDDVKLPLFPVCFAMRQLRRKENMYWARTWQSRVCVPEHMLGCLTPTQGGDTSFVQVITVGQSVERASSTSSVALAPKHMCDSPNSSRIGCLMLEGRALFLPEA